MTILPPFTVWTSPSTPIADWTSLSDPNAWLLLEDGTLLLLEDGMTEILLEFAPPVSAWAPLVVAGPATIWTPLSNPATH